MRSFFYKSSRSEFAAAEGANQQIAALKAELRSEREAFMAKQAQERAALSERHLAERKQLSSAVQARMREDRVHEIEARRNGQGLQHDRPRGHSR